MRYRVKEQLNYHSKYGFEELEVNECNVLDNRVYTEGDLHRARSSAYQYRRYNNLINEVKFRIMLDDNKLKIYRTK